MTSVGRLPLLLEAVLSIGSDLGLRATLQQIVDTATTLTGARYGALGVLEPDQDRTEALYTTGMTEAERQRVGHLLPERRAALPPEEERKAPPAPAFLTAPIQVHTQLFGHLCLAEKSSGPFSETDRALLHVLASQAGIAIGNARLYESARQRERWIEGAAAVTTALLTGTDAADALMTVAESARVLAGASAGVILQPTEAGGMEIVTASTLDDPAGIVGTTIAPGSPVLVQLLGGEPVFIDDSATDPRMTTDVRSRFGPSMMLPLQSGGRLIGTLALPRRRGAPPYTAVDRLLATQFASQAALALVMADAQADRERLAVYEDRDRIARDLHDLVVQRLFATEMMLESTRRRAATEEDASELLGRAVDELDSTIQEVRTAIFALQQPPAEAPSTFRGRVLRETGGAAALLGFPPSVHFTGAVDALVGEETGRELLAALRGALAAAHRRPGVSAIDVAVDATVRLPDGRSAVRLVVADDGDGEAVGGGAAAVTWEAPL
ncbi:two-component system sensor kinase [Streptomyces sp. CBMAI 2042]|uniref:GAF domain-containing sensor histidine kinase n=1 Tax=Streptomyces sp. CBMAI 2042 TaxID=2305222 RepID=UPI000F10C3C6|nr:GAF domain-containing protein [Streptomyces sp. CBMAI 2042]RLV66425.1 two-component system sensor kinase [Streptomyces sp. CBMAI 2042]